MASQSPHFPDCFYRVSVKGLCVKDGKVLLAHDFTGGHRQEKGELELPGGGLDFGEDIHEALKREIKEEMGLTVTKISEKPVYLWTANHGPGRGIEWYWVLVLVYQFDVENLDFTPSEECRDISFLSKEEMQTRKTELANQIRPLVDHFDPKDFQ